MKQLIEKILNNNEFIKNPPVLLDIGASGDLVQEWGLIAKHSICIAFDADDREFSYIEKQDGAYKKLYIFNSIVSDQANSIVDFYLTKSPYCSSTLRPDVEALKNYSFYDLFSTEKILKLNAINISGALQRANVNYIDWFKTDSQGTDLRLFESIEKSIKGKIIVAEFEPGIIKAYVGEDKSYDVLRSLEQEEFWLAEIHVPGSFRVKSTMLEKYKLDPQKFRFKKAPGWTELAFINNFNLESIQNKRSYFLGWIFSTIKGQHGFALELADNGLLKYGDSLFEECIQYSLSQLSKKNSIRVRIINKLISILDKLKA